jgi:hypothetical protein
MRTVQLPGGVKSNGEERRRQVLCMFTVGRDGASGLSLLGMKTPAETALEFCRKCLVWPYADVSDAWPNLVFEDLDPKVHANTFDFTDQGAVMATATKSLPPGFTLNIRAGRCGKYAVTVENDSVNPPVVLADKPGESDDLCVAIMEACIEAVRKQREVV